MDQMETDNFVTLGTDLSVEEARRIESLLKEAGIPVYLTGAATALAAGGQAGSITVEVAEADHEHALLVLQRNAGERESTRPAEQADEENPFVTLEVYYEPEEAAFAAEILRAKEIFCELGGTAPLDNPYLGKPIIGIQLRVREEDADRACALLGMTVQDEVDEGETGEDEETDQP